MLPEEVRHFTDTARRIAAIPNAHGAVMNRGKTPNRRDKGPKGEADRRFRTIAEEAKLYRGRCLFPADGNVGLCLEPPSRRHVIPRSSVLNGLKDSKSGENH